MPDKNPVPEKLTFTSPADNRNDWYMRVFAGENRDCVVVLHGHGSSGDQLFTRQDMSGILEFLKQKNVNIISPELRGNAWMNPAAVADLAEILRRERETMHCRRFIFACASMGGTGALIFALRHPELVDVLTVFGGASDIRRYRDWCAGGQLRIHHDIAAAITAGYTEADWAHHNVCAQAQKLTMPLRYYHSAADQVIPASEMHSLREAMAGCGNAVFHEVPPLADAQNWWSDHDAPMQHFTSTLNEFI